MKKLSFLLFILCFAAACNKKAPVTQAKQDSTSYGSNPSAAKQIRVNDVDIYLEIYGEGEPLILLHGNGGSIENFESAIPELSKHYKVIAIDSRLQGRSGYSDKELTYKLMAQDVADIMDSLKIDSAYFMGWSDGGNDILELGLLQPKKIRKAVIIGANYTYKNAIVPIDTTFSLPANDELRARTRGMSEKYRTGARRLAPDTTKLEQIRNNLATLMEKYPDITEEQLHGIQVPMLVVAGDHDMIEIDQTIALYKNLPKSNLFIVPNATHLNLAEFPELVTGEVLRYFKTPYRRLDPYYFFR